MFRVMWLLLTNQIRLFQPCIARYVSVKFDNDAGSWSEIKKIAYQEGAFTISLQPLRGAEILKTNVSMVSFWNNAFWLNVASQMTSYTLGISVLHSYARYDKICLWHRLTVKSSWKKGQKYEYMLAPECSPFRPRILRQSRFKPCLRPGYFL